MAAPHFIIHDSEDTVGVVVVEGVKAGQLLTGWLMDGNKTVKIKAMDPIPLGHKIAVNDIKNGSTIIKYGHDIGKAVAAIGKGRHAHVKNVKTKRW
ncbi:MAG: flagellar biosynthesis protein FlgA [Rhodospirillales bacterium]|nr:flagellar biosynthesis protein FlgA [Rhodospirillales bacterium]